jgi:hypothetical protein
MPWVSTTIYWIGATKKTEWRRSWWSWSLYLPWNEVFLLFSGISPLASKVVLASERFHLLLECVVGRKTLTLSTTNATFRLLPDQDYKYSLVQRKAGLDLTALQIALYPHPVGMMSAREGQHERWQNGSGQCQVNPR